MHQVSWMSVIATVCIVGGCVMMVAFGSHSTQSYTVDELRSLYYLNGDPTCIIYLVSLFIFGWFGAFILYVHGKRCYM